MTVQGIKMKYLVIIIINLFFLIGCNSQSSEDNNHSVQSSESSEENTNLGESSQPLKKISNIIFTDYIDGASTRVAMVTNGFEVSCEGQTNEECGGACGRKTYADADNNNFICCPSGETDRYLSRDYCTEMSEGSICATDTMCANGACGYKVAGASDRTCCSSGHTVKHVVDYCTEMPNGSSCWLDTMCSSNYCRGNDGGGEKGTCSTTELPDGKTCSTDGQCKNNACGRKEAGADNLICCPSGNLIHYAGYDYCTEMPNGNSCWKDDMCSSNYCRGNDGGGEKGTCSTTKLPDGKTCSTNGQCKHNACGRKTYADADNNNYICCPGGITTYELHDYCTEMPVRSTCATDKMCANDACGRDNNDHLICCPSGHTHSYWFKDYCGN